MDMISEHVEEGVTEARRIGLNGIVLTMPWGDELLSFKFEGKIYVKVADITSSLGIKHERQVEFLRDHPALSCEILKKSMKDLGIVLEGMERHISDRFWAISLRGMYAWLCAISVRNLRAKGKDEVADKLLAYQMECMDILHNYWTYGMAGNARFHIDRALNRLHKEGRLDLTDSLTFEEKSYMTVEVLDILNTAKLVSRPKNLEKAVDLASSEGTTLMAKIVKEMPTPEHVQDSLTRASVLKLLLMIEQTANSEILINVWTSRFLNDSAHELVRTANTIWPEVPPVGEEFAVLRGVIQRSFWKCMFKSLNDFYCETFQECVMSVKELNGLIRDALEPAVKADRIAARS